MNVVLSTLTFTAGCIAGNILSSVITFTLGYVVGNNVYSVVDHKTIKEEPKLIVSNIRIPKTGEYFQEIFIKGIIDPTTVEKIENIFMSQENIGNVSNKNQC